ncbi:DYW domain-containing protein [Plasmodiophora brassicae]|uniref:DYW domain-containing protein n=1 Tax=Plasmodiophora brassicae TaxID=37360 RepID=A0A3P3YIR9_PLABS|nr:unnamed protein product [Plasmodiophora brassicae]
MMRATARSAVRCSRVWRVDAASGVQRLVRGQRFTSSAVPESEKFPAVVTPDMAPTLSLSEMSEDFMKRPTVQLAAQIFKLDNDAERVWSVYQRLLESGLRADARTFLPMMQFCKRCLPTKGIQVLKDAIERTVPINDNMFCAFVDACTKTDPPMFQEAFDMYMKIGPPVRTHNGIMAMSQLARAAGRANDALVLVAHSSNHHVKVSQKLLRNFALMCVEANSKQGADIAERILSLIRTNCVSHFRDMDMFANVVRALLQQERWQSALNSIMLMDALKVPPTPLIFHMILSALAKVDRVSQAMQAFNSMVPRGYDIEIPVLCSLISAAGRVSEITPLQTVHQYCVGKELMLDDVVLSTLVSAYANAGHLYRAEELFRSHCEASTPDLVTFNAMIGAYGNQGALQNAIDVFNQLKAAGLTPTKWTLSGLLVACAHVGDIGRAREFLTEFDETWKIPRDVQHVEYLVDLHGRAGDLNTCEKLASEIESPDIRIWLAVLTGCREHSDLERAERVFAKVLQLPDITVPQYLSAFALMMSLYARAGRSDDVNRLRESMRTRGLLKETGRTTLQQSSKSINFVTADIQYHADPGLRDNHTQLMQRLAEDGYKPDGSLIMKPLAHYEDEARSLSLHSEKISIAYVMKVQPDCNDPIRMAKLARMCPDCHDAVKHASSVLNREIFLRDLTRHHRFVNGKCSCGDYW